MEKDRLISIRDVFASSEVESAEQAQRLIAEFDKSAGITLDFSGIRNIGEPFAKEIFISWHRQNASIRIRIVGACDSVAEVIERTMKNTG